MDRSPDRQSWIDTLSARVAVLAERWSLEPDGEPMFGFLSVVWPVRGPAGRPLVLKIHADVAGTDGERLALDTGLGPALVELVDNDPEASALLLQRLDRDRTLDTVAKKKKKKKKKKRGVFFPTSMLDRTPDVMPRERAERALVTARDLAAALRAATCPTPDGARRLPLPQRPAPPPEEPPRWVAIDPLPAAQPPQVGAGRATAQPLAGRGCLGCTGARLAAPVRHPLRTRRPLTATSACGCCRRSPWTTSSGWPATNPLTR